VQGGSAPNAGSGGTPVAGATSVAGSSGASSGAGGDSSVGSGGDSGGPGVSLCEQYCSLVMDKCKGAYAVYATRAVCQSVCERLPPGNPGDSDVNTVQCRMQAASIAETELPYYCPIAGPGGNGQCGTNCEALCGLMDATCSQWGSAPKSACLTECAGLNDQGTFSSDPNANQHKGHHVQCRLYHVSAAAADDPEQHCMHAAGASPCREK